MKLKLKEKLAQKFADIALESSSTQLKFETTELFRIVIMKAYLAGFDRAKAMYVDYAERFLTNPDLKPGDHHVKLFLQLGELPTYPVNDIDSPKE